MLRNFKMVFGLVGLLCLVGFGAQAESAFRMGTVDMQRAIQTSSAGKKAKTELEAEFNKRKKELEKKEGDLKKMKEDIEKKQAVLSEEVLGKKQSDFRDEMMKYQEVVQKNQMEIQKKERDLTQPILEKMRKVIAKVAQEQKYTMVIENSPMVLYAEPGHDLTDDVLKAFEKEK
jgi:outer membrane protein